MNVALAQGEPFWLDFEHVVWEWEASETRPTNDYEHTFGDEENVMISSSDDNLETAKKKELQSWVKNKVYTQISDQGQPRISTRWVYTYKNLNDKQFRLLARGFQDRDVGNIRNNSLTCYKEGLHIALAIMSFNHWMCESMDIKTAFLLRKELDWLVCLDPPKEAKVPPGYIWKALQVCIWLNWCLKILVPDTQGEIIEIWSSGFKIRSSHIYMVFWKQTA